MTAGLPANPVTGGVRSLEVRWIFPGQLQTSVVEWFGRFPTWIESREDTYLLDPQLRGLSVKVRGGRALEVKVYGGSPGILDVMGYARGRLEFWQKWSFPFGSLGQGSADPAGWRPVRKRRRIGQFSATNGPIAARGAGLIQEPKCVVELTEVHIIGPVLVDSGFRGDRPGRSSPQPTRGHRRARVCPALTRRCRTGAG